MAVELKKVLIVDDDPKIRELVREILGPQNYQILEAENGAAALEIIQRETVHLMITDRSMPEMGGLELLKALRDLKKSVPTLLISAYGDEDMWAAAIGLGAEDYVLKPFDSEAMTAMVRKKLAGKA